MRLISAGACFVYRSFSAVLSIAAHRKCVVTALAVAAGLAFLAAGCTRARDMTTPSASAMTPNRSHCGTKPVYRHVGGERQRTPWFGHTGGRLWAAAGAAWFVGENKFGWIRPADKPIHVTGKSLTGSGAAISQTISPAGYPGTMQPSIIVFPASGCWEVSATAGEEQIHFEVRVYPRAYELVQGCYTLLDAGRQAQAVIVGETADRSPDGKFVWLTIMVDKVVAGSLHSPKSGGLTSWTFDGHRYIEVLQRPGDPQIRLQHRYLLFITAPPGVVPGLACGGLAGAGLVRGETVLPFVRPALWHARGLQVVVREIRSAFRRS